MNVSYTSDRMRSDSFNVVNKSNESPVVKEDRKDCIIENDNEEQDYGAEELVNRIAENSKLFDSIDKELEDEKDAEVHK